MKIIGNLIDVHKREIYPAEVHFEKGIITRIIKTDNIPKEYILPGLIDSHIHIESSMITPGAFASVAARHGTVGVVSDPHEIANVMGLEGINFMINDSRKVPLKFWFGAPSCVPATDFESSGARIGTEEINEMLSGSDIKYLSEMMNFPGVISGDREVMEKISIARKFNKPVDGHAPGITGEMLKKYVSAGITTDHECSTLGEAKEKIDLGMKVLIREGSAARNLDALKDLIKINPSMVMLCSDDLHPEMLLTRHLNKLMARLIKEGYDIFDVIRCCTVNPVIHYNLDSGLLRPGDSADFIITNDYTEMDIEETWINGKKVYDKKHVLFEYENHDSLNNWKCSQLNPQSLVVRAEGRQFKIIKAFDGELLTRTIIKDIDLGAIINSDKENDVLKIAVKDRYNDAPPAVGYISGFGLKKGAFASSVAHDSHNIICIGTNDNDMVNAINEIVKLKGGLSVSADGITSALKLNIAGIMTDHSCEETARDYLILSEIVNSFGCTLKAPFMTLSFMALLVIPELKIGDKGLFDVNKFCLTSLFVT